MECTDQTYVTGYKIWEHELEWLERRLCVGDTSSSARPTSDLQPSLQGLLPLFHPALRCAAFQG